MFSKSCQYAIKAVIFIWVQSLEGRKSNPSEISRGINAPQSFTAKILQTLVKKNIIASFKGPTGGFFSNQNHEAKTIFDVVMAIDGDTIFEGCGLGLDQCSSANPCPLHDEFLKVRNQTKVMLTSKTLKELAIEVGDGAAVLARF